MGRKDKPAKQPRKPPKPKPACPPHNYVQYGTVTRNGKTTVVMRCTKCPSRYET